MRVKICDVVNLNTKEVTEGFTPSIPRMALNDHIRGVVEYWGIMRLAGDEKALKTNLADYVKEMLLEDGLIERIEN